MMPAPDPAFPDRPPPPELLAEDAVELRLIRGVALHYGVAPLWVLIAPENVASRRTAERAGLTLVDLVPAAPEALALGLEPELCRYVAERP